MSTVDCLPYYTQGEVVLGFGRGSKDLGIPTANFPKGVVSKLPEALQCGVYYGWASVDGFCGVQKMVLSVGWNVFYGNDVKTMETHILQQFDEDFYGENLRIVILGFIRAMCNFDSLDALITAIHNDIKTAEEELMKPENLAYKKDSFFSSSASDRQAAELTCIGSCQENGVFESNGHDTKAISACNGDVTNSSKISKVKSLEVTITKTVYMNGVENKADDSVVNGTQLADRTKCAKGEYTT